MVKKDKKSVRKLDLQAQEGSHFLDAAQLPQIRGRYSFHRSLKTSTWFQVGGPADLTVKPVDIEDLVFFIKNKPMSLPTLCLGVGSNILVRSGGVRGAVIRLGQSFSYVKPLDNDQLLVGAGTLDRQVALYAQSIGLGGFSFLAGIPGTIGGAVFMNAGCYGSQIQDILVEAMVVTQKGQLKRLLKADFDFGYRSSNLTADDIVVSVIFQGVRSSSEVLQKEIDKIMEARILSQPIKSRTGGSTYANPEGYRAWELIDQAGCRGLQYGGALVSPMHCNFLINTGEATSEDLETLMEEIEKRVFETTGIRLRREIKCIGEKISNTMGDFI